MGVGVVAVVPSCYDYEPLPLPLSLRLSLPLPLALPHPLPTTSTSTITTLVVLGSIPYLLVVSRIYNPKGSKNWH